MEKLKTLQLPFIIILLVSLAILFLQYQSIVEENSVLKMKVSEGIVITDNILKPINAIGEKLPETPKGESTHKVEVGNLVTVNDFDKAKEITIAEIETNQENKNTKKIPFEFQELDYEWATLLETSVSDAFMTSLLLEEFTLESVECRSSTCEVKMPKGQDDTFHQSVLVLFALEELGIKHHSFKVIPEAEDGTVVFYFDKYESE